MTERKSAERKFKRLDVAANVECLRLLRPHRKVHEVNMV